MDVETIKVSSKGQVVIPLEAREELHIKEGTVFAVVVSKDTIILKKVETPSKEDMIHDLETAAREGRKRLEQKGIKEKDIPDIVQASRHK